MNHTSTTEVLKSKEHSELHDEDNYDSDGDENREYAVDNEILMLSDVLEKNVVSKKASIIQSEIRQECHDIRTQFLEILELDPLFFVCLNDSVI